MLVFGVFSRYISPENFLKGLYDIWVLENYNNKLNKIKIKTQKPYKNGITKKRLQMKSDEIINFNNEVISDWLI